VKKRKKIKDLLVGYSLIVGQASRLSMQMQGVRFIELVSGRINPTPIKDKKRKEKGNRQNTSIG